MELFSGDESNTALHQTAAADIAERRGGGQSGMRRGMQRMRCGDMSETDRMKCRQKQKAAVEQQSGAQDESNNVEEVEFGT